jgi:cellulose synthase/poly-beta-1,6-N-acetylglucosamine synthase-like glycosyltransferase
MLTLISIFSLLLSIPALVVLLEVLAAKFLPDRPLPSGLENDENVSFKVLVPAHNEEDVLDETLTSLLGQVPEASCIVVVADNCTDRTTEIARSYGVEVLERVDEQLRGKGYALDCGIRHLQNNPPDVLIVMDADCRVQSGSLQDLANFAHLQRQPVQAKNLQEAVGDPAMKSRIAAFAFVMKNFIRPSGLRKLGFPCLLTGTGMAFPWDILNRTNFATDSNVEDMQIGIELAKAGCSPSFFEKLTVVSGFPEGTDAVRSQRTRWEHGHLQTINLHVPGLVREAVKQFRLDLFILAMEIVVPPLSLYVMMLASYWALVSVFALFVGRPLLACVGGIPLALLGAAVIMGWGRCGREILPSRDLLSIPLYLLWKIPFYLNFLINPEKRWIRTKRKGNRS